MLKEITELYLEESRLYNKILNILENIDVESIEKEKYQIELENIDYLIGKIADINLKIEQLKTIYVTKFNISDFSGDQIRKVEKIEVYDAFKNTVTILSKLILKTKKLNDEINYGLHRRVDNLNMLRRKTEKVPLSKSYIYPQNNISGSKIDKKK